MIERPHRFVCWLAGIAFLLVLGCAPLTLLAALRSNAPAAFGTRIGPFYVAGFEVRTARCRVGADCDPAILNEPESRQYEVWVFTRQTPVITERPRVDLLLLLPLRS